MAINDNQAKFYGLKAGKFPQSISGTFAATGDSASLELIGEFNVLISGGIGTVAVQRSFDNGATWYTISQDAAGAAASYTTAGGVAFNGVIEEREADMLYRLSCTSYTSGTVTYRISQ